MKWHLFFLRPRVSLNQSSIKGLPPQRLDSRSLIFGRSGEDLNRRSTPRAISPLRPCQPAKCSLTRPCQCFHLYNVPRDVVLFCQTSGPIAFPKCGTPLSQRQSLSPFMNEFRIIPKIECARDPSEKLCLFPTSYFAPLCPPLDSS